MAINQNDLQAAEIQRFMAVAKRIEQEVKRFIVGQDEIIRQVLISIFAGSHVLLEGVPGLGKTMLVKTLSEVMDLQFNRIQFTPDLMPADVVGTNVITKDSNGNNAFRFQPGPVFANLVLADEINRATPKTQSALLEAMQEKTVTVGGQTYCLPRPFFVLATQNPLEMEGTYPLPEAQLDRFFFKLIVKFPRLAELHAIIDRTTTGQEIKLSKVTDSQELNAMLAVVRQVPLAHHVKDYALRVVLATHPEDSTSPAVVKQYVRYGASPRGAQAIILAAKIRALLEGRYNVAFEDIRTVAYPALRHRLALNFEGQAEGKSTDEIITVILNEVKQDG